MLSKNSCELATNLALMLYEQNKNLTPAAGSLMQCLSSSAYNGLPPNATIAELPLVIQTQSTGVTESRQNTSVFFPGKHDVLMDNYEATLKKLITNHLQHTRSVVYPKVQLLAEQVALALKSLEFKQPEDFFDVTMYTLPDVFDSELVQSEVISHKASSRNLAETRINFGEAVRENFDLKAYITTGDSQDDALIHGWVDSVGTPALHHYLFEAPATSLASMSIVDAINHAFINFLFYRSLVVRQDLGVGISSVQLLTYAADNRDYHANTLKMAIETHRSHIRQGQILDATSNVAFSYMGERRYAVTLYETSFRKAAEKGATLEQVFGFIASNGSVNLTADMLTSNGAQYAASWSSVRGLYLTHITSQRDLVMKSALKLKLTEVLYDSPTPEDVEFLKNNPGFEEGTAKLVNSYVAKLDSGCLENINKVCVDLVAAIGYRHTGASRIISEMVSLMEKDPAVVVGQAAFIATVKYCCDFLIEGIVVS